MDVPAQHSIDVAALNGYIRGQVPAIKSPITQVKKFGYGQSNPTYHLIAEDGSQYVMRKRPAGKLIASAHRVDREFRVMKALGDASFPVPRVLRLCQDTGVLGAAFYLMTFEKGRIPSNSLASMPEPERRPVMDSIINTLAQLHSLSPAALGLTGAGVAKPFGTAGGYYPRQLRTMANVSAQQVKGGGKGMPEIPALGALIAEFEKRLPEDRVTVVHGDYKPDNIILHPSRSEVIAVVDWELSTIGHPLSDLANLCLVYHIPASSGFYPSTEGVAGVPSEEEVLRRYCRISGTPYPSHWGFFIGFAFLRLAVITQGVAMRHHLGQASDTGGHGDAVTNLVPILGSLAWRKLTGHGPPQQSRI